MDYTTSQNFRLLKLEIIEGRYALEVAEEVFWKANNLYSKLDRLSPEQKLEVIGKLRQLNIGYWEMSDNKTALAFAHDVLTNGLGLLRGGNYLNRAVTLNRALIDWRRTQSMHNSVIGELEQLVEETAAAAKR